ncbi:MAG: hypothetical protein JEY79_18020 [Pseudodesulfovibrio sp.]|nr:hypothetical protein [Pseudodesulfovibrio sp.]
MNYTSNYGMVCVDCWHKFIGNQMARECPECGSENIEPTKTPKDYDGGLSQCDWYTIQKAQAGEAFYDKD